MARGTNCPNRFAELWVYGYYAIKFEENALFFRRALQINKSV